MQRVSHRKYLIICWEQKIVQMTMLNAVIRPFLTQISKSYLPTNNPTFFTLLSQFVVIDRTLFLPNRTIFLPNYSSADRTMFGQNGRTCSVNGPNFCQRFRTGSGFGRSLVMDIHTIQYNTGGPTGYLFSWGGIFFLGETS